MKPPATVLSYKDTDGETGEALDRLFQKKNAFIEINPGKVLLPPLYKTIAQDILDLPVYENDVWLCSYPRTGSTWAQEMVWLIGHDLDYEGAKSLQQVIYTARNPKDMCVSFYHYCALVHNLEGTFEEFCELFLQGKVPVGPVWSHILGFWSRREDPNVLILKFEDMKRDLPAIVRKTAKFLDKTLTAEEIDALCDHLSFGSMKKNRAVNLEPIIERTNGKEFLEQTSLRFIRKGEIGDWKNHMSDDVARRFDEWAAQNLEGTCLNFD